MKKIEKKVYNVFLIVTIIIVMSSTIGVVYYMFYKFDWYLVLMLIAHCYFLMYLATNYIQGNK